MGDCGEHIRVYIVDDHQVVREGVRRLIESSEDLELAGEAADAPEALTGVLAERPDVVIVDSRLPNGNGIDLIRSIRSRRPEIRCLVLTSYPAREALYQAVLAGASGYVTKDVVSDTLTAAVRKVGRGGSVLDWNRVPATAFVERPEPELSDIVADLTAQERRILDLIAEGHTNREIAASLFLAEKTIRNYVSNILAKLGTKNRTQAATLVVNLARDSRYREAERFTA